MDKYNVALSLRLSERPRAQAAEAVYLDKEYH